MGAHGGRWRTVGQGCLELHSKPEPNQGRARRPLKAGSLSRQTTLPGGAWSFGQESLDQILELDL
ncbi:MAG: hypothetical protein CMJ86_08355 [Planctomycetes bacterium]|nr:hypothetical protein [Planctomycetota bacterium]